LLDAESRSCDFNSSCVQGRDGGVVKVTTSALCVGWQLELLFEAMNPLLPEYLKAKIAQKEKEFRGNKKESTKDILMLYEDCLQRFPPSRE
jgi:hypothetical protein